MAEIGRKASTVKLALLGAETLLGRELEDVFKDRTKNVTITTYSASGEGSFGEEDGEAIYVEPLDTKTIEDNAAILVAGTSEGARKAYELVKASGGRPGIIDCTGHLEHEPEARIVAPPVEHWNPREQWLTVIAHPAAIALAAVLERLAGHRTIRRNVANVFEPASERGLAGLKELNRQTADLLSFKPLDKTVFDAQLGFNMLAEYGEDAPVKLSSVEQRIERHTATLLARSGRRNVPPMPSIRLVQAPVFHGYSISLWVEFEGGVDASELGEALASAQIEIRSGEVEAPTNAGSAGQSGLVAGNIRLDPNNAQAAWLWVVGDNLRISADVAVDVVRELARSGE